MRTLELREGWDVRLPEGALSEAASLEIARSSFVDIEFPSPINGRSFVLRPTNVVGLIPVAGELMLRVVPKVPVANLFGMLELIHELPSFRFYTGIGRVEAIEDIYERLARMLAQGVASRVRRGLYSDYVEFDEETTVFRGRLDVPRTLLLQRRGSAQLHCAYQVRTVDVDENRILLWTLDRIPRLGLQGGVVLDEVKAARRALFGSVRLAEMTARSCEGRQYNRFNSDYALLHALCRFFLERMGPGVRAGDRHFLPFTVNMPQLFQEYVIACLRRHLPSGVVVYRKHRAELRGNLGVGFEVDAVLVDERTGAALAVVDAKYKNEARPSSDDVQQVIAYAAHTGASHAFLVYPTYLPMGGRGSVGPAGHIEVATVGLALDGDLFSAGEAFAKQILHRVFAMRAVPYTKP